MIYIHRFIYSISFIILVTIATIIMCFVWLLCTLTTPIWLMCYYVIYGNTDYVDITNKACNYSVHFIFKFLELIKPKK